ncbi:histone lysine [Babesia ovis]|uniref:Histone lysine n=1 Tax=Babesia ovis TaxID=5869 RepID=A0A9W5WWF3_BABOV|nr:histone lysine [Babesia ovis]
MADQGNADSSPRKESVLRETNQRKISEQRAFSVDYLDQRRADTSKNDYKDEKIYKTAGTYFMERRMWREALRDLHCRLFLLEKDTKEYEDTIEMINSARYNLLSEVMPIPVVFKEMLFIRNLEGKLSTWISQMGYTERLVNSNHTENVLDYQSNTLFTNVSLKQGSLLMRVQPFATSPWRMESEKSQSTDTSTTDCVSCFHCLCVIKRVPDMYYENTTLVACPCSPYECPFVFCSEECFLNNGAVHTIECEYLVKLKSFASNMLNDALILLVVRTLIRCSLCRDKNNYKPINVADEVTPQYHDDVLQRILDFKVDYSVLEAKHQRVMEDIKTFAHFLLNEMGVNFCLYLSYRELVHLIVVLWTKSLALTPEIYIGSENVKLGGVAFSPDMLYIQQSNAPTLSVHFDRKGKISLRSIYKMEPGTRLYINTAMDKYLPSFKQHAEFWSVGLLLSAEVGDVPVINKSPGICSLRCGTCITSFCHVESVDETCEPESENPRMPNKYVWVCDKCSAIHQEDLNMLQNKAEEIIKRVYRLQTGGHHLTAKKILENFVWRWAGVLHTNHYLLYNAHVMLAGIKMNKGGSNTQEALTHLTVAVLMAEEMMPLVCHEKAHLYSRLADLMGQLVMSSRVNRKEDMQLKQMTMEAAYAALWNWTILGGTESREAITHMQKCRALAFQMNVHVPSLSTSFVINVPSRYLEVFKLVTGKCVIPSVYFSTTGNLADAATDNVATVAFMAAQSGIFADGVMEVLMSVESRGILHMGTGLSMMGIAASNCNMELVKEMTDSISTKVAKAFDFLTKNDNTADAELTIVNLILSLVGGNELGITPLMAMASVPAEHDTHALKSEIIISRLILECADKLDDIIARYRDEVHVRLGSLHWLIASGTTVKSLILEARTHNFLKGQTVLHYAASKGKRNLVQYLARVSGNVNNINLEGATPLHLAALGGHLEVCETLISFGAKHNAPLNTGEFPMHLAIYALHEKTVKLLVEQYLRQAANEDTSNGNTDVVHTQKRRPSIWHALVSGIYRPTSDSSEIGALPLEELVSRLAKAVQIAQYLVENTSAKEAYVWSNSAASQILRQKWQEYMEANSHRFDPRENFQKLSLTNVNSLLQKGRSASQTSTSGCIFNDETDAIFAATRAIQFLSQLLLRAEEGTSDTGSRHAGLVPASTETR